MKTAVRRIVSVGILLILLFAMQRLVMPKYVDDVIGKCPAAYLAVVLSVRRRTEI